MANRTWAQVKPEIVDEIDTLRERLVICPLEEVPAVRERIRVFQVVIAKFENHTPPEDQQVSSTVTY